MSPTRAAVSVEAQDAVQLPFDLYRVLGLTQRDSLDTALARKRDLSETPPELAPISNAAIASRAALVERAGGILSDPSIRSEYDASLASDGDTMDIPREYLLGALMLLIEAGNNAPVSRACLEHNLLPSSDGALLYALAEANLSGDSIDSPDGSAVSACTHLRNALSSLQRHSGLAPQLLDEIERALGELAPAYVLELISLPLTEEYENERSEGVNGLRTLLWERGESGVLSPSVRDRQAFVSEAFRHLTAKEQAVLFTDAPEYVPAEPEDIYNAGVAQIVSGFQQRNARQILDADELFGLLDGTSESDQVVAPSMRRDVSTERAVCALLLGRADTCAQRLGLNDGRCDEEVEYFVRDYAEASNGDTLPGLCALCEHWLADVAFGQFRDSADAPTPSLDKWFNDASVQGVLNALDRPLFQRKLLDAVAFASERAKSMSRWALERLPVRQRSQSSGASIGISQLLGERSSNESENLTKAASAAALGAVVLAGTSQAIGQNRNADRGAANVTLVERAADGVLDIAGPQIKNVDKKFAEKVVRRWQYIKADALGPQHRSERLQSVLDGEMLKYWQSNARETKEEGFHWVYSLRKLRINRVEQQEPKTRRAVIEATIREVATLCDGMSGEGKDSYESTYRVRYNIERKASGGIRGWKLVGGRITY